MLSRRTHGVGIAAAALVAVLAGVLAAGASARISDTRISGAGSSFVFPLVSQWIPAVGQAYGYQVAYASVGSGAGIAQRVSNANPAACEYRCSGGGINIAGPIDAAADHSPVARHLYYFPTRRRVVWSRALADPGAGSSSRSRGAGECRRRRAPRTDRRARSW